MKSKLSLGLIMLSFKFLFSQHIPVIITSEIKGIKVYIDNKWKGNDITQIDSLEAGTHIIKILKDTSIILNRSIVLEPNSVVSINIKNNKEVQVNPVNKTKTGSIKVFSELNNVQIYLDEAYKGKDISFIDSVPVGTHYLKAVKDNVIIYSDLVNVNQNSVTTVLIKNTKEVKEKILESKYEEIQNYKKNRLEVLLSSKYVTNVSGITNSSTYYPGYFSYSTSVSNFQVSNEEVKDWFIVRGGKIKVSEWELATLTGNQQAKNKIDKTNEEIDKYNKKKMKRGSFWAIIFMTALISALLGFGWVLLSWTWLTADSALVLLMYGIIFGIISYIGVESSSNLKQYPTHYFTLEEAIELVDMYNKNLKKSLGLPENFEP
ncbi:MAG TPA: hypothetical protein PK995_06870 [Bacteroidia bacterium]|nr:hypothetical protein [Bacteroidia bacterium]